MVKVPCAELKKEIDGLFVKRTELQVAYELGGVSLDWYQSYNASWGTPWKYFDRTTDINTEDLRSCNETRMVNENELEKYVRVTGDSGGVHKVSDGSLAVRCWEKWWLAPACRSQPANCIPVITGGSGWGIFDFQQKSAAFNMPSASQLAF